MKLTQIVEVQINCFSKSCISRRLLTVIIQSMSLRSVCLNVITLSGFHCKSINFKLSFERSYSKQKKICTGLLTLTFLSLGLRLKVTLKILMKHQQCSKVVFYVSSFVPSWGLGLVAHTTPVREDLGSNCTQTQMAFLETLISLLSNNGLKKEFFNL
jgi:hypothetical protein